ncbi:hypothetical protein DFH11DRAFT_1543555 [Phellopilus nigrolimitatus]|nr:hypothetical protein DFH11DRAFT_1543555 [Phellopilus nigrolimitatus]
MNARRALLVARSPGEADGARNATRFHISERFGRAGAQGRIKRSRTSAERGLLRTEYQRRSATTRSHAPETRRRHRATARDKGSTPHRARNSVGPYQPVWAPVRSSRFVTQGCAGRPRPGGRREDAPAARRARPSSEGVADARAEYVHGRWPPRHPELACGHVKKKPPGGGERAGAARARRMRGSRRRYRRAWRSVFLSSQSSPGRSETPRRPHARSSCSRVAPRSPKRQPGSRGVASRGVAFAQRCRKLAPARARKKEKKEKEKRKKRRSTPLEEGVEADADGR